MADHALGRVHRPSCRAPVSTVWAYRGLQLVQTMRASHHGRMVLLDGVLRKIRAREYSQLADFLADIDQALRQAESTSCGGAEAARALRRLAATTMAKLHLGPDPRLHCAIEPSAHAHVLADTSEGGRRPPARSTLPAVYRGLSALSSASEPDGLEPFSDDVLRVGSIVEVRARCDAACIRQVACATLHGSGKGPALWRACAEYTRAAPRVRAAALTHASRCDESRAGARCLRRWCSATVCSRTVVWWRTCSTRR